MPCETANKVLGWNMELYAHSNGCFCAIYGQWTSVSKKYVSRLGADFPMLMCCYIIVVHKYGKIGYLDTQKWKVSRGLDTIVIIDRRSSTCETLEILKLKFLLGSFWLDKRGLFLYRYQSV